ncbi:MAG: hypothetical protein B6D46_12605 [Polyangiaceae bacterium UTPRO1]|nr:MAG: hypothetical protein B6D46_12605 [Polyangiaceae bacterium UTPRO1]
MLGVSAEQRLPKFFHCRCSAECLFDLNISERLLRKPRKLMVSRLCLRLNRTFFSASDDHLTLERLTT